MQANANVSAGKNAGPYISKISGAAVKVCPPPPPPAPTPGTPTQHAVVTQPRFTATTVAGKRPFISNVTPPGTTVKVNKDEARALQALGAITAGPLPIGSNDYELLTGQAFTIVGAGFGVQGANSQVLAGAVAQTITAWTPNRIDCVAVQGANANGALVNLSVRNQAMQVAVMPTQVMFVAAVVVPGAPAITAVADNGGGVVQVNFNPPASDGGDPITKFTATASVGGAFTASVTSPIMVNVGLGWTGTFTVTATNSAGTGAASAPSNAVTTA